MSSKKFLKIVLSIFVIVNFFSMANISITNYLADPLWLFSNQNKFNEKQDGFDERQQRTNYIYFKSEGKFDGILLGSSRATFVNQNDFVNMNIFNYSSNSMHAFEYKEYIDFAKKVKGKDLKYIVIGSDFYNTSIPKDVKFNKPDFYINKTTSFFYKYKMLFSYDLYLKSKKQIRTSIDNKSIYYDRDNVKYQNKVSEEERKRRYNINLQRHTEYFSYPKYEVNNDYLNILKTIKKENPNTKFIIYTSAITSDLLVSIIKNGGRWEDYKKWLYNLIEVFGEVNHFMTINSITKNLENYPDDDHAYPSVLKLLANKLSNFENRDIPEDFGIVLTKDNIEKYLKNLENKIENYDVPKMILQTPIDDFDLKKLIFDISKDKYSKNNDLELNFKNNIIKLNAINNDPIIILNEIKANSKNAILSYEINSNIETTFQLFYKKDNNSNYNEVDSYSVPIKIGNNKISLLLPSEYINNELRVDLVSNIGDFEIKEFKIYSK